MNARRPKTSSIIYAILFAFSFAFSIVSLATASGEINSQSNPNYTPSVTLQDVPVFQISGDCDFSQTELENIFVTGLQRLQKVNSVLAATAVTYGRTPHRLICGSCPTSPGRSCQSETTIYIMRSWDIFHEYLHLLGVPVDLANHNAMINLDTDLVYACSAVAKNIYYADMKQLRTACASAIAHPVY